MGWNEHLLLSTFLALSLVRMPKADVAAFVLYVGDKGAIQSYYTKSELLDGDIEHASALETMIKDTAKNKATMTSAPTHP